MSLTKLLLLVVYLTHVICEEGPIVNDAKANFDTNVYEESQSTNGNKIPDDVVGGGDGPDGSEEINEHDTSSSSSADTNAYTIPTVTLKSGYKMPLLGLGTDKLEGDTVRIVKEALEIGYRLIDTAKNYEATWTESSEVAIAKGIAASGVPRSEIFLTTKIMPDFFGMKEMRKAVKECLKDLQTDYLDLLLLHHPSCAEDDTECNPTGTLLEGWKNMAAMVNEGLVRDIGVSNVFPQQIKNLSIEGEKPISVLQNWFDPYHQDRRTRAVAAKNGIAFTGYSTLGVVWTDEGIRKNPVFMDSTIKQIADRRNCAPSDVVLKWAVTRGVAVIPGSTNSTHLRMNYNSLKVKLTEEDLMLMDGLNNKLTDDYGSSGMAGGEL
ncbi:methylglyoxal reductase DkgB-like [Ciona intestinalis]